MSDAAAPNGTARRHSWEELRRDVYATVRGCRNCAVLKVTRHETGLPWQEFWRDGRRLTAERTPACEGEPQDRETALGMLPDWGSPLVQSDSLDPDEAPPPAILDEVGPQPDDGWPDGEAPARPAAEPPRRPVGPAPHRALDPARVILSALLQVPALDVVSEIDLHSVARQVAGTLRQTGHLTGDAR